MSEAQRPVVYMRVITGLLWNYGFCNVMYDCNEPLHVYMCLIPHPRDPEITLFYIIEII